MRQRQSDELCENCPLKYYPGMDDITSEVIKIYHDLSTPFGQRMPEAVIQAHKPDIDRMEFMRMLNLLNFMKETIDLYAAKKDGYHSTSRGNGKTESTRSQ